MICVLIGFTVLAAVIYSAVLVWFHYNEDALIFRPDTGALAQPPSSLNLASQDVDLLGEGGLKLKARLIPPASAVPEEEAAWLVYLHGSSGSIGLLEYNEAWLQFRLRGLGLIAVDYRGYGESEGTISEQGIYQDAELAYRYLRETLHISARRIVIYGFSMGAAVAIDLAARVEAAGLIVEGAWLSIPQLGAERYPYLPISCIARNRFDSCTKIKQVLMPKLFVHARADSQIPISHGRRLFELAPQPKEFHELGGDHGTSHTVDPSFFDAVCGFISALGLPVVSCTNLTSRDNDMESDESQLGQGATNAERLSDPPTNT